MDVDRVSQELESKSTREDARKRRQHGSPLRGLRGTSDGEVARVLATEWKARRPSLPADMAALDRLFGTAFEDGLVAIGLVAALAPDAPAEALELGLGWLDQIDDVITADSVGWLVLGPAALASGRLEDVLDTTRNHPHPDARRAGVSAALAFTPATLEGAAAAALRERVGMRAIRFVDGCASDHLATWADAFVRDEAPSVRKALRRVLRAWADGDPGALVDWAATVRGGVPKLLREEIDRAARRRAKAE